MATLVHARYCAPGKPDEHVLQPKEAVPDTIVKDGITYARPHVDKAYRRPARHVETIMPFVSYSLPKWWPFAPRHDAQGRCLFASKREAEEACARARHAGEEVRYDPKAETDE
jgi:hypothetical protein